MTSPFESDNHRTNHPASDAGQAHGAENNHGGCGCGHDHGKTAGTEAETTASRDLGVKDVNANGAHGEGCTCGNHGDNHGAAGNGDCNCPAGECSCDHHHACGCPDGQCQCGHHEHTGNADHKECGCSEKDFTNPDTVNPDGTNPAVQTVNKAENYNEGSAWNDGIAPRESENPESYENDDKNVN